MSRPKCTNELKQFETANRPSNHSSVPDGIAARRSVTSSATASSGQRLAPKSKYERLASVRRCGKNRCASANHFCREELRRLLKDEDGRGRCATAKSSEAVTFCGHASKPSAFRSQGAKRSRSGRRPPKTSVLHKSHGSSSRSSASTTASAAVRLRRRSPVLDPSHKGNHPETRAQNQPESNDTSGQLETSPVFAPFCAEALPAFLRRSAADRRPPISATGTCDRDAARASRHNQGRRPYG
mmetsp:Transcript_78679/g.218501  ORF Transcript_78679/g.218501 Transcript_78679/m.218501 type:complete len:241 (+) Transcript_78679:587-1309(+)